LKGGYIGFQRQSAQEDPNRPKKLSVQGLGRQYCDRGIASQGDIELSSPLGAGTWLGFWIE
jgi:hypothetical protein